MIRAVTVCDINYLKKGLAMHKSLCETIDGDFTLYWLCMDDEIFNDLLARKLKGVVLFRLSVLEDLHNEISVARNNKETTWGGQYSNFVWTMTTWFTHYILKSLRDDEYLMYIDADICLYESPQKILDVINGRSCGIHTHGFTPPFREVITGWYNVGIVVFKHDPVGLDMATSWKSWMLDQSNPYFEKYGKTGDQKYLELFLKLWPEEKTCVFDEEWDGYCHMAPWNTDEKGKCAFFHFSHFTITETGWACNTHGEWFPSRLPHIRPYYEHYYETINSFV